jgi:glutathione S-transferase
MPLKIYGVRRSRASRNIWFAKEAGIAFDLVPVVPANRLTNLNAADWPLNTASPEFRAINPNGLIPTIDDDGLVISESLAINLYLAKKHGGPLGPRDLPEDAKMTMWALWAATECEPHSIQILYHRGDRSEAEQEPAVVEASIAALRPPFAVLEATLRDEGGFVVGGLFTVADINTAEVLRYAQPAPELFAHFPRMKAWIEDCQARPAFREMMEEREAEPA